VDIMQLSGLRGWVLLGVVGVVALAGALFARSAWPVHAGAIASPTASNVAMNCEPGQQAVVRQAVVGREMQVSINCVTGGQSQPMVYFDQYGRPVQAVGPQALPVAYAQPAGLVAPVVQPVVAPARTRTASVARTAPRENGRSWQKTALIIGGSTGAGAGIGGIIGGKKGALIGAAIGGGSASIFEAAKRR
jgi:hypothetical protein